MMKVERYGSAAHHGKRSIEINDPEVGWDNNNKAIVLKKSRVKDFSNGSNHDYEIHITLEEISSFIRVIGEEPTNQSPEEISQALSPNLRQLHRIVNACIGTVGNGSNVTP